jgi:hypothetical protein
MTTATGTKTITCRLAQPDEGPLVKALIQLNAGAAWDWIDWLNIGPQWLIGEVDGVPSGCMMFSVGVPIARADMLSVNPALPKRQRAILARDLAYAAWAICQERGAQAVLMMIEWSLSNEFVRVAMKRGAVPYGEGVFLVKPVKRSCHDD